MLSKKLNKKPNPLVVVGTGLVALDVVVSNGLAHDPLLCAGGTCGNVLIALAYLGCESYPVARLRSDAASKRVTEDLKSWGVKLDFVSIDENGSTPVVIQHIRHSKNGRTHSFSRKCPGCGAWLPWYKAVRASAVPELSPRLPKADVFYFDRTSRGAITLAEHFRNTGAMAVFEPSSESDPKLMEDALSAAHIVKVASDRLAAPYPVERLVDTAGAGDWCTAGIISSLGKLGPKGLEPIPKRGRGGKGRASGDDAAIKRTTTGQAL